MGHTPSCLGEDGGPGCRISSQLTQVHFGLRCRKFNSIVAQQHGPMEGATVALRFFFHLVDLYIDAIDLISWESKPWWRAQWIKGSPRRLISCQRTWGSCSIGGLRFQAVWPLWSLQQIASEVRRGRQTWAANAENKSINKYQHQNHWRN